MEKSLNTRSTWVSEKMSMASRPLVADTTRYPLVASMNLSTESSCSLSSTQRMIFFGRMIWGNLLHSGLFSVVRKHFTLARSCGRLALWFSGADDVSRGCLSWFIYATWIAVGVVRSPYEERHRANRHPGTHCAGGKSSLKTGLC